MPGSGQPERNRVPQASPAHVSGRSTRGRGPWEDGTGDGGGEGGAPLMVSIWTASAKAARTHIPRIGVIIRTPFFNEFCAEKRMGTLSPGEVPSQGQELGHKKALGCINSNRGPGPERI